MDRKLNKAGVLKHVKEIISKLRTVSAKMSNIFEYHQALGLVPLPELDQKSLSLRRQRSLDQVQVILIFQRICFQNKTNVILISSAVIVFSKL